MLPFYIERESDNMITVTPQGQIYLCKTPLENDYKNQLTFANASLQEQYFNSTIQKSFDNYTYIKKDNVIKVNANIDEIITCNYLFYKNVGFTNKIYYCFITNMEYISENVTAITFETDVYQTWQFEIEYKRCFVEREHVNDDNIGSNIINENLNLEKYVVNSSEDISTINSMYICIISSIDLLDYDSQAQKYSPLYGNIIGNVFSGLAYFVCPTTNYLYLQTVLNDVDEAGQSDGILALFMVPSAIINTVNPITSNNPLQKVSSIKNISYSTSKKTDNINGYVPKNNKLFVYPYNILNITNYSGSNAELRYERFSTTNCDFNIIGNLELNQTLKIIPSNYNGKVENFDEGLTLSNYPVCAWTSNIFSNYIAQNQNQINMSFLSTGLSTVGGVLTGLLSSNPLMVGGSVASGLSSIFNTIAKIEDIKILPDQAKGNQKSTINANAQKLTFGIEKITIPYSNAEIIDNYFSMYGYKINNVKIPNITGRLNWNFVKTIDCNFDGNIPQTDINIIKTMFNNGVTLWHNANTMYDYSQSNNII